MPPISQPVLDTILTQLALLFLTAAGDTEKARHAATKTLAAYNAQSEEELRLAAEIISFGFHALEALAQAADPTISLNCKLRLRGSAVSLSRQSHKAQRKLDQLQHPKSKPAARKPVSAEAPDQTIAQAIAEAERIAKQITGKHGGMTWSQANQKRALTNRMNEKIKKQQVQQAEKARREAALAAAKPTLALADAGQIASHPAST